MSSGCLNDKSLALQSLTVAGLPVTGAPVAPTVFPAIYDAGSITMNANSYSVFPTTLPLAGAPAAYKAYANWAPSTGQTVPTASPGATPITLTVVAIGSGGYPFNIRASTALTAECDINWFIVQTVAGS